MKLTMCIVLFTMFFLSACGGGSGGESDGGGGSGGESDGGGGSTNGPIPDNYSATSLFDNRITSIALAENSEDIYVAGIFENYKGTGSSGIVRLNRDGSIDTGFNVGSGFVSSPYAVVASAIDGSDDVYVGGSYTTYNGTPINRIVRLNNDGSIDTGFSVGSGFNGTVLSIAPAVDGSGDVYVGGVFTTYNGTPVNRIVRLNNDGSIDTGFNVGSGFNADVYSIALAPDGSLYVGGDFTNYRGSAKNRIARIHSNGDNDNTVFDVGTGFDGRVNSIVFASDGSGDLYAGGDFELYRGNNRPCIARINSDGSNDDSFNVGAGCTGYFRSIAVATDGSGDTFAGGNFTTFRGNARGRITRIKSDGSNDGNFGISAGFNDFAIIVIATTDGSGDILVGGGFLMYDTTEVGYFARLDSVGQLR
ncbi:hypothetical protein [Marinobacter sp.]|uniref:hypothetical protein n=1 Tax=Marinobacter sp. TaxID=50741 RepID=UPI003A9492C2